MPSWDTMLTALERAHPCSCGGSITQRDTDLGCDFHARLRVHFLSCPKRRLLEVLWLGWRELPEETKDAGAGERTRVSRAHEGTDLPRHARGDGDAGPAGEER